MPKLSFEDIRLLSVFQWRTLSRVFVIEELESFEQQVAIARNGNAGNISSLVADIAARKESITYGTPYDDLSVAEAALTAKYGLPSLMGTGDILFQEVPQESSEN